MNDVYKMLVHIALHYSLHFAPFIQTTQRKALKRPILLATLEKGPRMTTWHDLRAVELRKTVVGMLTA